MAYISQKQLGGVLDISDVTISEAVGTGSDLAQARAINFNQETPDIIVSLAAPNPPVAKLYHVVNRGSVPITIDIEGTSELVVNPGPVYGVYWNGENYTYMQVEGVGTVSHTVETPTAEMQGSGSPLEPLGVNVRVSSRTGNAISVEEDGLYLQKAATSSSSIRAVDTVNGNNTFEGSLYAPFKTIAKALEDAVAGMLIVVFPGTYNEDFMLPAGVTLEGFAGEKATVINGQVTYTGASTSSIRNLVLAGKVGEPTLSINGATNGLTLANVGVQAADGSNGIAVRFVGDNAGEFDFKNTSITGNIAIANNNNSMILTIDGGRGLPDLTINDPLTTVKLLHRFSMGTITHGNGKLIASGISYIEANEDGDSLISTATDANNGLLILENVGFLQPDGSFGELVKTGNCPYAFGSIHLKSDNDTFVGARIFIDNAGNIHAGYEAPSAYVPTSDSLVGHLEGINAALQAASGGLGAVEHTETDSTTISGAGTSASPISVDVKVSGAANNALTTNPDGLYVPIADSGLETITTANGDTIDFAGSGTVGDPLSAEVSISTTPNNRLVKDANGLLVPAEQQYLDIIFNASYHWLDDDRLMTLKTTREFILPQALTGSQIVLIALPGENVASTITISKVVGGVTTDIGTIQLSYDSVADNDPGPPTLRGEHLISFAADTVFNIGDELVFTTDVTARFDNVSIDLLARRPM